MPVACLGWVITMTEAHARTEILIGAAGLARLRAARVLVAGLGGVGAYVAEALGRAGIGHLTLLDHDVVAPSNLNRQLLALHSTLGRPKVAVMAARLHDIDPTLDLTLIDEFLQPDAADARVSAAAYDYVADCIDSIACKAAFVLILPCPSTLNGTFPTKLYVKASPCGSTARAVATCVPTGVVHAIK